MKTKLIIIDGIPGSGKSTTGFQDTIGFAFNMQMEEQRLLDLTKKIQFILSQLDPVLIYFYQVNVEQNWRWICEIRGLEFTQGVCGIHTDNDFIEAGKFWTINQDFVFKIVQEWDISNLG